MLTHRWGFKQSGNNTYLNVPMHAKHVLEGFGFMVLKANKHHPFICTNTRTGNAKKVYLSMVVPTKS